MASPISRPAFAALNAPDIFNVIIETGRERPPEYTQVCNISTMPWNPVKNQQLSGIGSMPDKPEGTRFTTTSPVLGTSKEHLAEPRGLALEFTWEGWRDELYETHRMQARELARSSRHRLEVDGWNWANDAFAGATFTTFDGLSLCNAAHTSLGPGVGTQANRPSPDQSFGITYIQGMVQRYHRQKNEMGLPSMMAAVLHVIDVFNLMTAREVLGSSGVPYSGDNEVNAIIEEGLRYMVTHYLNVQTYHFAVAAKGVHDIQLGVRDAPMFNSFDDPYTMNAVFTGYQRNTLSYADSYRGVDGSTG